MVTTSTSGCSVSWRRRPFASRTVIETLWLFTIRKLSGDSALEPARAASNSSTNHVLETTVVPEFDAAIGRLLSPEHTQGAPATLSIHPDGSHKGAKYVLRAQGEDYAVALQRGRQRGAARCRPAAHATPAIFRGWCMQARQARVAADLRGLGC